MTKQLIKQANRKGYRQYMDKSVNFLVRRSEKVFLKKIA